MSFFGNIVSQVYRRDRLVLVSFGLSLFINIIIVLFIFGKFGFSQEPVPLHFNIVYGIDYVDESRKLYQLPATGLVIFLVNFLTGSQVYEKEKIFSYYLGFSSLLVSVILAIAGLALFFLNF